MPRAVALQEAARFHAPDRSYFAKYPGETGKALRKLCEEVLARMGIPTGATSQPSSPPVIPQAGTPEGPVSVAP